MPPLYIFVTNVCQPQTANIIIYIIPADQTLEFSCSLIPVSPSAPKITYQSGPSIVNVCQLTNKACEFETT